MKTTAVKSGAPYGVVGRGNAANHLLNYFRLFKTPYIQWTRASGGDPARVLARCRTVFLLVPDSALQEFIDSNPGLKGKKLVHFSGALTPRGASGIHPFAPLGPAELSADGYKKLPFATEKDGPGLRGLLPGFPNPYFRIKKEEKALYHALCVLGANFPVILWRKAYRGLAAMGVPRRLIMDFLQASLDNFKADPETALTGPLARNDRAALAADRKALKGDPFARLYAAFGTVYGKTK